MSEMQMEQKGHPQSFLPPKPQVPEAGSHASHIGKRETIHEASDAFSAHSGMLRSLSVPEARTLTSSDGGHVLPLYPSVQLFMNPQNLFHFNPISIPSSTGYFEYAEEFTHLSLPIFLYEC